MSETQKGGFANDVFNFRHSECSVTHGLTLVFCTPRQLCGKARYTEGSSYVFWVTISCKNKLFGKATLFSKKSQAKKSDIDQYVGDLSSKCKFLEIMTWINIVCPFTSLERVRNALMVENHCPKYVAISFITSKLICSC